MRYDIDAWQKAVKYYRQALGSLGKRRIFVHGKFLPSAFFSIAPLSMAANELGIDLCVRFSSERMDYLFDIWDGYESSRGNMAMAEFLKTINDKEIEKIFVRPHVMDASTFGGLGHHQGWMRKYRFGKLMKTADLLLKEVFDLKAERFGISFELVLSKRDLDVPLQDYLDSYLICYAMYLQATKITKQITVSSSTARMSSLDGPEPTAELISTLVGLELSKNADEPIFQRYRELSQHLRLERLKVNSATFAISGKGYPGRHLFGEKFGYPTPNGKSRWTSPGGILYKFPWYPQAEHDSRDPQTRIGFTQTVPIDIFIDSTFVDYQKMRERNRRISDVVARCDVVQVKSDYSDFEVGLVRKDGKRRQILGSDSDARCLVDPDLDGRYGMMANIPGGESFTTPEYVKGKIVGDVVIEIDRSYRLSPKKPFVVQATGSTYVVIDGPKHVIEKFKQKKEEAWKRILYQEKNKSLPQEIVELKKKNFESIGEFAINTNPNARLCDYLIVNEKIANMIHVAFGSGFEPDRDTGYHMDLVIDCPRQKLDIFGTDEQGNVHWIIRSGKFVV